MTAVLKSRFFPHLFAVFQALLHLALVASGYWMASRNEKQFDAVEFIRQDLERPLFEPYGFCGAWTSYTFGQSAALGLDVPVYVAGTIFHELINWEASCVEAMMTPRGNIIVTILALPIWFLVGLGIRRMASRRWRPKATGKVVPITQLALIPLPFAVLLLPIGILSFAWDPGTAARLTGLALWLLYLPLFAAERLRRWPFKHI